MTKVSVIIPAYNAAAHIGRAIESVLGQDYPSLEVIIVNDGSTDELEGAIRGYLADKRMKYLTTKNMGVAHAINAGLKEATGGYISFLHADDKFLPGKIKKQIFLMEKFPAYGVSYTHESYFLEGASRRVKTPYFHFSGDIFYFLKRSNFIHMSTAVLKKETLKGEVLDETLKCHEEWDLFLRLSARGVRFLDVPEVLSAISIHSKNLSSDVGVMDATRAIVGKRAKNLWHDFKENINPYSARGILNLKRYLTFKICAMIIGFPEHRKFNPKSPREMLNEFC